MAGYDRLTARLTYRHNAHWKRALSLLGAVLLVGVTVCRRTHGAEAAPGPVVEPSSRRPTSPHRHGLQARHASALQAVVQKGALSQADAVRLALLQNERLQILGETVRQSSAREAQVTALTRPSLSLEGRYRQRESLAGDGGGSGGSAVTQDYYLSVTQPLFSGFRAGPAKRAVAAATAGEEATRLQGRREVALAAIRAFHDVLHAEQQVGILRSVVELQRRQTDELAKRVDAGDARRAELLLGETELAKLTVERLRAEEHRSTARIRLGDIVGTESVPPLESPVPLPPVEVGVEELIRQAHRNYSGIAAARHRLSGLREQAEVIRRQAFPDIDLEANYYGWREGFLDEARWDVMLSASMPLFEGRARVARLREAESRVRQAVMEVARLERAVAAEVREVLTSLASAETIVQTARRQVASATRAHADIQREFSAGTTTQVELLAALSRLVDARLSYEREVLRSQFLLHQLRMLCGQFPIEESPE